MEALSPTMEEGQLVRWLKKEGDQVKDGDVLAEIETDKATMELVARGSGVLRKIMLPEGDTAPIGQVIAVIAGADEDIGDVGGGPGAGAGAGAGETAGAGTPDASSGEAARSAAGAGDIGKGAQAVASGQTETQKGRGAETGTAQEQAAGAGGARAGAAGE
ncbi:MAG TPA: biotin/lipoyl-containing protein, partial [Longimicrobiales bacterium]|nr:biotin/lipoyl-containing protein [Longimicrobiales bacterium]